MGELCFSMWTTTNVRNWLDPAFAVAVLHSTALLLEKCSGFQRRTETWQLLLYHQHDDCSCKICFLEDIFLAARRDTKGYSQLDLALGMTEYLGVPRSRKLQC